MIALTPVLSRQSVRPDMAARGLRPAAELAATKPCGTRVRYYAGCRCSECRAANSAYERERAEARKRGEHNGLVSADQARAHLLKLSKRGVGRKTAADAAKVAASVVSKIIDGQRTRIRAQTEKRILAVTETTAADGARKSARATWRMLDELIDAGYSKARLGSEILGRKVPSLQISRRFVEVKTEARVRAVYERLRMANAKDAATARARLQELREEGFRSDRIQAEMDKLAAMRGWGPQRVEEGHQTGRWPAPAGLTHRAAVLINVAHQLLTEDPD